MNWTQRIFPKNLLSKKAVVRFFTTIVVVFVLINVYKYFNKNFNISVEIWIGLATTLATTYYQAAAKIKDEIYDDLNSKIAIVSTSIRKLETRIDSVLLTVKKFENSLTDLIDDLKNIEDKIDKNEVQLLRDRFEIYKVFFNEILTIKTDIAKIEGVEKSNLTIDHMLNLLEIKNKNDAQTKP